MKLYFYKRNIQPQDDYSHYNHSLGLAGYHHPQSIGRFIIYGTVEEAMEELEKVTPRDKRMW